MILFRDLMGKEGINKVFTSRDGNEVDATTERFIYQVGIIIIISSHFRAILIMANMIMPPPPSPPIPLQHFKFSPCKMKI